jgi:hypothetical protein
MVLDKPICLDEQSYLKMDELHLGENEIVLP